MKANPGAKSFLHRLRSASGDQTQDTSLRWRSVGQFLGLVVFLCLLPLLAQAAPQAGPQVEGKIDPRLVDQVSITGEASFWIGMVAQAELDAANGMDWEARGWFVYQALTDTAQRTQADILANLDARGLAYESFWINNSIYVRGGDLNDIKELAGRPDVARIKADDVYYVPNPPAQLDDVEGTSDSWGIDFVKAPNVWALGVDGSGVVVAGIDTGVQYDHPQLASTYRGALDGTHAYNWCDPAAICTGSVPCDNNGHGTHTMGTMSGENDSPASDPNIIGMAPGSTWMACKGCESNYCSDASLLECAEWILAPTNVTSGACGDVANGNPAKRPHIVNNSWGDVGGDDWYRSTVQAWSAAGIFPTFSAGNDSACGSLGSPGDYQESFSSANLTTLGTIHPIYSSRGPSTFGMTPYCKPNVAAPGTNICSAYLNSTYACWYTGTSMASPHSAGTVALLWQACPTLIGQVDATIQTLHASAGIPPADGCSATTGCSDAGCNCTYGYGLLDAYTAVRLCTGGLALGHLDGYVRDLDSGDPVAGAAISIEPATQTAGEIQIVSDPTGYYTLTLVPGTYSVTASKNGYVPETVTGIEIIKDATTAQDFALQFIGLWTKVAMPDPNPADFNRFDGVFDPHDNLVYFPGGRLTSMTQDTSIWTYDPRSDLWADTGCDLLYGVSNISAAYVDDDGTGRGEAVYVVGGYDIELFDNIDDVQRYYPSEPGCIVEDVPTDPFPGVLSGQIVGAGGVAVVDNQIYYAGGWQSILPAYFSDQTWVFDPRGPAGSRWAQIPGATLSPGRSYINVAVHGSQIYAMGGIFAYVPYPSPELIPTKIMEVFDTEHPEDGWVRRADLPVETAEGRGFGIPVDTAGVSQAGFKLYVAGGGQWPVPSSEVLEYDVAGDTWNAYFPNLNAARRDHAGAYVTACTPDPADGLPAMWVFGGRVSPISDEPPYGESEYYALPCDTPALPEASFATVPEPPLVGCEPLTVRFTDVSSGTVLARQWDFGDGGPFTSNWRPARTFDGGSYTVTLTVSNTTGSDTISRTVEVLATPQAAFTYTPTQIITDTLVQFQDASSGNIVERLWRFGDGSESTQVNPAHTFETPGTYTVSLTLVGDTGCTHTTTQQIYVRGLYLYYFFPTIYYNY